MVDCFNSDQWLCERRDELVNYMFNKELGISDFRNTNVILNFDELQSNVLIARFDSYRKALRAFFSADDIRSLLDYYYLDKDKKPLLNLIKQILKYYGYRLNRVSEYQGNYGGVKMYKSKYTIIKTRNRPAQNQPNTQLPVAQQTHSSSPKEQTSSSKEQSTSPEEQAASPEEQATSPEEHSATPDQQPQSVDQ